jgi:hypothetical protein
MTKSEIRKSITAVWVEYDNAVKIAQDRKRAGDIVGYAWRTKAAYLRREALLTVLAGLVAGREQAAA